MHARGILSGPIERDLHGLCDIVAFTTLVQKMRWQRRKIVSDRVRDFVEQLRCPMLQWIARRLDKYVADKYSSENESESLTTIVEVQSSCHRDTEVHSCLTRIGMGCDGEGP